MDSFSSVARRELHSSRGDGRAGRRGRGRRSRRSPADGFEETRRFNNWIKAVCIEEARAHCQSCTDTDTVQFLDVGCGKGGDIAKCVRENARLVALDPCSDSLAVATQRHGTVPGVQFIEGDACSVRDRTRALRLLPGGRADVVVCMFACQHAFTSPWKATMFCDTLAAACRDGGTIALAIPDAGRIRDRSPLSTPHYDVRLRGAHSVHFHVHGHTPVAPEPLLCPDRLVAELARRGITEIVLNDNARTIRARYAERREQRRNMHCPETLSNQQWELADLQRYIVVRRPSRR